VGDDYASVNQFVGKAVETNILNLDTYKSGSSVVTPWSGHYWPIYEGGIGVRYGESRFPHSESFEVNYKYFKKTYLKAFRSIKNLDILSPAEKYDLISEDKNWSLTKYAWTIGKQYFDESKEVETWMGICHGWAPAAFIVPEPKKSFELRIPLLDKNIRLYPDDVKALVSQLWAQAEFPVTFVGGRCDDKNPKTDENGRIISKACFDTNPASWHLALLNLMGRDRKSFVFDATYDYEVWNQPVASYKVKYFNPNDKVSSEDLNTSIIAYSEFKNDPFKKYRSSNTKSIVGIELELNYVVENMPDQINTPELNLPSLASATYYYDLEIDENNNIIGGEWYQVAHPDMLWKPTIARPVAKYETENLFWNGNFPIPVDLLLISNKNARIGEPISAIIDQLLEWSR
jgi:hypothetical protein